MSDNAHSLASRIAAQQVAAGHMAAWWLGGSGFVLKTAGGTQIAIDPYLSDCVRQIFGNGRAFPAPISPEEMRADFVIATHWHEDHLDPEAIPVIAKHSPATRFIMPPSAMARALSWGVSRSSIIPFIAGSALELGDASLHPVPARHEAGVPGWEVPDAMGVILEVPGLRIYHTGDTEYDVRLRLLHNRDLDVVMACINGTGGNMNAHEAALLCWTLDASTVIPIHHILWEGARSEGEQTLDPTVFAGTYHRLGGSGQVVFPEIGGLIDLHRPGA
jgi:L-ascorbate 6-phosphate lactonase